MSETDLEKLRFPIGKYQVPTEITDQHLSNWISVIAELPNRISQLTSHLTDAQLDTPYREGGWTIRQVVHHLADSHMNSTIRFRLALTEENPSIKPYYEDRWANLTDAAKAPIAPSLAIISGVHQRWVMLLQQLKVTDWKKTFVHPEYNKEFSLEVTLGLYAWHSNHHAAHIEGALERSLPKAAK